MQPGFSLHYVAEVLKGSNTAALRRNGHADGFAHWKCCAELRCAMCLVATVVAVVIVCAVIQ